MTEETINKIAWWIPFKKARNTFRNKLINNKKEKWFLDCINEYNSKPNKSNRFTINTNDLYKCLYDNTSSTQLEGHYTYHPAWAARCIKKINPTKHVDISSIISFNTLVSAFVPIDFYDYRPAEIKNLSGLECKKADLLNLHFDDNSIESLSCMHTIEHVGLGRYGDTIDPDGDLIGMKELSRVLKIGGNLLFVVPVGKPRLQYNAHRIYSYEMIIDAFKDLKLVEFSLIANNYSDIGIINNANAQLVKEQNNGCGCFWFKK